MDISAVKFVVFTTIEKSPKKKGNAAVKRHMVPVVPTEDGQMVALQRATGATIEAEMAPVVVPWERDASRQRVQVARKAGWLSANALVVWTESEHALREDGSLSPECIEEAFKARINGTTWRLASPEEHLAAQQGPANNAVATAMRESAVKAAAAEFNRRFGLAPTPAPVAPTMGPAEIAALVAQAVATAMAAAQVAPAPVAPDKPVAATMSTAEMMEIIASLTAKVASLTKGKD